MAKYSIPDLTSEELSLLGSGAYTEEEILRRREQAVQRRAAREQEAKAYTPPPVEEAPLQEAPSSSLWSKTADVVGGAVSELWPGIKSGYRGLLGGMAQGLADDPSQVIPSIMPPGTAALNRMFGGQSLEERAAESIGLSDYLAKSSRQLNESNAALNAQETQDIPQIPSGELGNVFDENPEGVGKYYGRQLGHSLGFMGPAIAAGVASRGKLVAPMVTMGLMTKASDYGEFRGKGASEEQASLASTGTGVLEGVLGAIPIGIATKPGTGLFKRAIGAALGEELTEIPTTIGQMATEEAAGITNYTTEDYIQGIRDTALIAGIPGAAGAAVAHPFSRKPTTPPAPAPFIAGQEMSDELERLVKEAKSKTPDMSKDIDMANSFVSLNLDDITKMPQFTMDLKGHKFQDNNMVQPIPTEVRVTPQNDVDELRRQAKEEQLRSLGLPRLPDSVWEGGRQTEPVMPGPFQTQNAEPALQPDPLTGQAPAIPEMTFNNEFRPPSQLQGREVLGLRNYNEKTGIGTGPIGPANAPTEAPVQPEGMPEVPSQYQQSYTLPPFKQGYDLKLGKQTKQAETKASPAAEIKSLLDQLNRKPKLANSADTDMAILERQEDTDRFEQVIRKGNIQDAHTLADTLKGMLKSDRAKSMVNAFLSAGFLKNVQVRIADTEADLAMLETDNARALYQPAKDGAPAFILLAPSKAGPTRHGMSPDLVYHEIGHAVTYEMVEAARTGVDTTPEIQALYEQLDMLRQDVAANIDKMATNEAERQAIQNATSDVHEMISYTLTNQNFNKAASRFRVKGITVRQWIKNILSKLATKFGVSVKDANNMMDVLFDRALTAVQETAKYDPAKFEVRGKVDKETGTVDKRLVNKDTGKPLASEMQETVLTKGQPRFVKRDDTGKVVDEVAERRNRLQPDTTEVAEAEEITMESESQPSPDSAYDSKLKLYGNKASAGNVPVSQVASKLDKGNVRPIDIGVMDELLRSGSSAEVPLFDQETGREIGATTTGEGETVQGLMGVEAREAANDSAEGPKPAAVKRPFESLPPDRSPAGWFVNVMRGLFKPTAIEGKTMGKETMVLVEAMNEYKGQQFYRAQQALNVLADSPDQKNMLLALEGDEEALKKLSADDAQAVSTIVNTIDMLQRAGVVHELASLKNPTEKDIAVAKKVVASILGDEKYRHRAYAKDIQKRGISTKWVADLLRNKDKKGSLWQNAKAHLIANELTIPSDFKSMGLPTLERMYAHWTGLNPEGKSKSEIIASLEKFRNKSGPEIDAKAEELVKMLLDLTPTPGPGISRLYAGNKQDLTIVTPRSKIDEPIRKLWGEVEDPLAKIVVTVTKLIEFNARHRFLMNLHETGVKDGWIAEADDPKADPSLSVTLEGREFGPLDGMRVTPNVKSILDSVLKLEKDMEFGMQNNVFQGLGKKVGKGATKFWERGLISPIKALMLTTNAKVWITNLLSGPGVLMANGNFTGTGGLTVIKNAWGLANITKHKKWDAFTDKVISQGWMDSALFGELTNEQLSDYASAVADSVFTEDTRRNKFRKLSIAAKDKATGSKDVFRNMFALMDMGYKLMNGVNEANRLRAIHPDWSDEKVMAVASDRVKMTNYTRGRAIPVAKWADKKGLQFFATYMSEIGRTLGYNTMIGVSDVIAGSRDGNPKQIAHGMSRVIGVGLATMYYDQLLSFAVSGAGMLMGSALSILGEDDDEDRNEKARDIIGALPEDWRNQLLVPIAVTKDGKLQMQAADRFDFHGQWNSIFRAAAKVANGKEDWKFLANEVQNLFFMHSLVRNMLNPNPGRLQKIAPEAYETAYKFLTQTLPLSDSTANRIINTAMTADVPVIRTGLLPTINNMGKPASERQDVNWLGFNPIEYDPKLELVRGADRYNGSLSANRNELAKLIANTGMALDKPGLEKFYNSALDEEISAFSELNAKVKGARAMGYNNSQIASILASQNVRRDYIPYVMHGKFVPRPFGDRYLQSAFIDTQFSDATPERKKALSNRLIQARAYLDQLRMEYMQNDRLN